MAPPQGRPSQGPKTPRPPQPEAPPIGFVVAQMAERNMLPAIYFIFSRRGCDGPCVTWARSAW
jgi:superfamily II RNA helicase